MKAMSILKFVVIIFGFLVLTSYSGQWEVITGKNDVRDIALTGNTLWAATTGGVVKWNPGDNSYTGYTTLDGLLSCNINQVTIDKKGRPLVATKKPSGLFVYENRAWEQINVGGYNNDISDKIISGLEVDRFGNVWVYIRSGLLSNLDGYLLRYDGQTWNKYEGVYGPLALDPQKNLLAVDSLFYNKSIHRHQFRIVSFNGSEFVSKWRSKAHKNLWWIALASIAQDSKGNPWISYYDERIDETYGVVCNDTMYNTLDGLADDNVRSITADESGTVWCATDGGISKFTGVDWVTYDTSGGVASNLVYRIITGSDNTLYAATSNGISILESNQWKTLKTINEPPRNDYTDMIVDKRDAVILSGSDHIAIFNGLQWKMNTFPNIRVGNSYYSNYNNKSFIRSKDGGNLYAIGNEIMGNENEKGCILKQETGVSTFFKAFSYRNEKYNRIMSPAVACSGDDSCFWLTGIDGNLIMLNKQTAAIFPPTGFGIIGRRPRITCMLLDIDGRSVWVGYETYDVGSGTIVHFDGDTVKNRVNVNDGIAETHWLTAIARDSSGNLWFASRGGRKGGWVSVLRGMKLTHYFMDSNGKGFGECNTLFVDKSGMVWVHSYNGIARFDGSSWKLFDSAAVSPDLPYVRNSHIIQDSSGTVWFGTSGSGLLAYKDNRWYQFKTRDGIPSNNILSCALDSKDNLWILTDYGIAMRKSDGTIHNRVRRTFSYPGNNSTVHKVVFFSSSLFTNNQLIKRRANPFYFSSKSRPDLLRYTLFLFDLRGRVILRQTIHYGKSFILPESNIDLGSGLRIFSIIPEDTYESQKN